MANRMRATTAFGAAGLIVLPWLIKNWLYVDNPFSPFLNRLFPNPYVHVAFEELVKLPCLLVGLRGHYQHQGLAAGHVAPAVAVFVDVAKEVEQGAGAGRAVVAAF